MHDEARTAVADLIKRYGPGLCNDAGRTENLLRDVCGAHRREVSVLVGALRERVIVDLLNADAQVPRAVLLGRLSKRLEDDLGVIPEVARWGVESWALALGVIGPQDLSPQPAAEPPDKVVESSRRSDPSPRKTNRKSPRPSTQPAHVVPADLVADVHKLMQQQLKIQAIELYRKTMGVTLAEAKAAVEAIASRSGPAATSGTSTVLSVPARDLQPGSGQVVTIAGLNQGGYADGLGASARFKRPRGIAVDAQGVLYIADHGNGRIRTVALDGAVSTIGSAPGFLGTWKDGPLPQANFAAPVAVAIDAQGIVYVAQEDGSIRRIMPDGRVGSIKWAVQIGWPADGADPKFGGLAVSKDGTVYVSDRCERRRYVYQLALGAPTVRIGAKGGVYGGYSWSDPTGLALDSAGNLYVADCGGHEIDRIPPDHQVLRVVGGHGGYADGDRGSARFRGPMGVAADDRGHLYVADTDNHRIRRIEKDFSVVTIAGSGQKGYADGPAVSAQFNRPADVAIAPDGTLYVADEGNHCIRVIRP